MEQISGKVKNDSTRREMSGYNRTRQESVKFGDKERMEKALQRQRTLEDPAIRTPLYRGRAECLSRQEE